MEDKRKNKLLEIYSEIADDRERYIKLYKNIDEFQFQLEKTFETHINVESTLDKQIDVYLKLLSFDSKPKIVHLGFKEAIESNDYSYLDKALNTYVKLKMLVLLQSGADHCCFSLEYIPYLFALKRFKDIEKLCPKECGLSTRKIWGGITTNLIMYLYYQEEAWKEKVLNDANKYLSKKNPLEDQAIVEALVALVKKDFNQFSLALNNVCKGRKKSREFDENKFSKSVSFYSLGLYNFTQYLYPNEIDKVNLPNDDAFLMDYYLYQQSCDSLDDGYIIHFNNKLNLLEVMFDVETPSISLMKNGRNYEVDVVAYNNKIVKQIKNML